LLSFESELISFFKDFYESVTAWKQGELVGEETVTDRFFLCLLIFFFRLCGFKHFFVGGFYLREHLQKFKTRYSLNLPKRLER